MFTLYGIGGLIMYTMAMKLHSTLNTFKDQSTCRRFWYRHLLSLIAGTVWPLTILFTIMILNAMPWTK